MTDSATIPGLLRAQARQRPDAMFLRFADETLTYAQADAQSDAIARALARRGVAHGTRVAVALPNGLAFPLVWLALAKRGAIMVPVSLKLRTADLAHILRDAEPALIICAHELLNDMCAAGALLPHPPTIEPVEMLLQSEPSGDDAPEPPVRVQPDDILNIQYTSGTTGLPKGCVLTHDYWIRTARAEAQVLRCTPDDVLITAQPYYYMDGQWLTVAALLCGGALVLLPRFSASTFWQSARATGATAFYMIGTMPMLLLKQTPDPAIERSHRVRAAVCSGIPTERHAEIEARFGFPWRETYGSTESGADLVVDLDETWSVGSGAMGRPIDGKEARVVDADGCDVPDGNSGELILRGQPMMLGYWRNAAATAEKLQGGWLHTGDLVVRDARGHDHMVGRLKEMIRRGGENIAAAEVEAALCAHAAVLSAAVLPVPDELRGEEVLAYIEVRKPRAHDDTSIAHDILAFVRARLADYKVPRFVEFVDEFPRTPSERIAKPELMRQPRLAGKRFDARSGTWS